MDFESPDVAKDFPGLYASDRPMSQMDDQGSDYSDDAHDKPSRKDVLLIGKRKEKKESKKDKGYMAFEGESSGEELDGEQKSPTKGSRKSKSAFKFSKRDKQKEKVKEKRDDREKKKESKVKLKLKDRKKSKHIDEDADDRPIFGVPLAVAVERSKCHDGIHLPAIVRECIDYIEEHGLSCEGIYRLSGVKSKVQKLRSQYNRGEQVCLFEHEPHIVASLLKLFLRELPDPVLTHEHMPKFEEVSALKDEQKKGDGLKKLLSELPMYNRLLLSWIFVHMQHIIQRERVNKMNMQNVSIVLSPTMQISHRVLNALFTYGGTLFQDVILKKYVPPLKPETSRLSLELPDTPTAIQDEITKQESLLAQLHAEMFSGLADREREEQLWEVQRVVTQLKRKLRFTKRAQEVEKIEADVHAGDSSFVDDIPLDTRLMTASYNQHHVSVEHRCTVYVSWQPAGAAIDSTELDSKLLPQQQPNKNSDEVAVVGDSSIMDPDSRRSSVSSVKGPDIISAKGDDQVDSINDSNEATKGLDGDCESGTKAVPLALADELKELATEEHAIVVQQEELIQLSDELRRKIDAERLEVEKLKDKIQELQSLYHYRTSSYNYNNSDDNSSNDDDFSDGDGDEASETAACGDEERLWSILEQVVVSNQQLENENADLINRIQWEREACLEANVQIRLLQCNQETTSVWSAALAV